MSTSLPRRWPTADPSPTPWPLRRWPTALGLAVAVAVLFAEADRETAATCVGVAVLCYLAAAALHRPWIAWAGVLGGSVLVVAGEMTGVGRWAALGATGAVLVAVALVVGAPRRPVLAQSIAFATYGGLALAALAIDPRAGVVLAGLTLAAHAAWDAVHYRRGTVVPRSLAEACIALDLPLGFGIVVIGLTG